VPRGGATPGREARAAGAARMAALVTDLLPIVRAIPGIEHAAAISGTVPLYNGHDRTTVTIPGRPQDFQGPDDAVDVYRTTRDYPSALGVRLLRGRLFSSSEDMQANAPVVLLNDVAAARFFPGTDAVGESIGVFGDRVVIGVVGSIRAGGPESDTRPEVYLPF